MSDPRPPEPTTAGTDPVSELLYRWDRDRQAGVAVSPEELCQDTPELLAEVTRRVRALEAIYGVPNRPDDTAPDDAGPDADRPRVPGYEVGDELGRGGMGVVWKATDTRLNRPVALKVLPAGGGSAAARARFRVEAEAAAGLVHPHIVQVYEVGEAGGRPYLALEYVPGGSLADRLAAGPLPPADAAGLVETVARAVDHAHKHGVLHRDLKPANILLANPSQARSTKFEPNPGPASGSNFVLRASGLFAPKVADFGLAKRLGTDAGATRTGDVLGTPAYMAPEQAAGRPAEVGVAADVYGLGAVLYAGLTGRPPFDGGSALETLDQVVNRDPVPPSKLRPGCPRDLEVICLKCLRKDPAKRYASAADLADDLRRWRAGEPIAARPVRLPERLWLWAKRRPALAALSAALVLVAAGSVAGLTALYLEARHQRDVAEDRRKDAEDERDRAERSKDMASTILEFFIRDVFDAARPEGQGGLGKNVSLLKALEAALPRIETVFAGQLVAEANLRDALATIYRRVGDEPAALAQNEKCVALRRLRDPDDPMTLRTQALLAQTLQNNNRIAEAEKLFRDTLRRQVALFGADDLLAAETENALGMLLYYTNRAADAVPLYRHVLEVRERRLGPDDPLTLEPVHNLAMAYSDLGRQDEAEPLLRRTIAARERGSPTHPHRRAGVRGLVVLFVRQGRFADAEPQARTLLDLERAAGGPDHPDTLIAENSLGLVLHSLDRPAEAEAHLRRSYDGQRARRGDVTARIPPGVNLVNVLVDQGKAAEAEPITRDLLAVARPAGAHAPDMLAAALSVRAACLLALGRPADALPLARESRELRAGTPPGDVRRAAADSLYGACLTETGDLAAAEPLLVGSRKALADHPAARPEQRRAAASRLARFYEKAGRPAEAAALRAK